MGNHDARSYVDEPVSAVTVSFCMRSSRESAVMILEASIVAALNTAATMLLEIGWSGADAALSLTGYWTTIVPFIFAWNSQK